MFLTELYVHTIYFEMSNKPILDHSENFTKMLNDFLPEFCKGIKILCLKCK